MTKAELYQAKALMDKTKWLGGVDTVVEELSALPEQNQLRMLTIMVALLCTHPTGSYHSDPWKD